MILKQGFKVIHTGRAPKREDAYTSGGLQMTPLYRGHHLVQ